MVYLETAGRDTDEALREASIKSSQPVDQILAIFDFLADLVQRKDYYGCNFLNIISEMPREAERVNKQIKKQKDGVRNLFKRILEPIGKEAMADEIYILFEGALIANKVHNEVWPVESAKMIAKKLLA